MSRRSRPAESTVDHADIRGSAEAAFMVMMRRELPLTMHVGLATITTVEDSPSPRPTRPLTHSIARSVLWVGARVQCCVESWLSTSVPMAQMKPTSSRASAVTTLPAGLLLLESSQ
jgi:hypothetical protein